jgi:hypothetical protein
MATITMTRQYPIERDRLYAHLTEPTNWPSYYHGMITATPGGAFTEPGDEVSVRHRLLGRSIDVEVTLLELDAPSRFRTRAKGTGLPPVEHVWDYADSDGGTSVTVTGEMEETTTWLGRAIDRHVLPRQLERDVARTLDNLDELIAYGLDAAESSRPPQ